MRFIFALVLTVYSTTNLHPAHDQKEADLEMGAIKEAHQNTFWRLKVPIAATVLGAASTVCGIIATFGGQSEAIGKQFGYAAFFTGLSGFPYGVYNLYVDYKQRYHKTKDDVKTRQRATEI